MIMRHVPMMQSVRDLSPSTGVSVHEKAMATSACPRGLPAYGGGVVISEADMFHKIKFARQAAQTIAQYIYTTASGVQYEIASKTGERADP